MTTNDSAFRIPHSAFWLLGLLVYFFGLNLPFMGPDEPRYAQVAREMMDHGDWITPTLGGFNWFEKPALLYWLEIVSYKIFGVSEFAARLGPTLFGLGTVAALWVLGRSLTTENTAGTEIGRNDNGLVKPSVNSVSSVAKGFPNYLALIAASTLGIIVFSRAASFDIVITFPVTAACVCFYIFDSRSRRNESGQIAPLAGYYFFIGVALIAKGLIGILFPFGIVGLYYVLSRRLPSRIFVVSLFWGVLLAAAVASIWYAPMYLRHGQQFVDEFIIQHHFQRFTSNKYQHPQPFYFFLWVLPLMTLPWMPFFFGAIFSAAKGIFYRRDAETRSKVAEFDAPRLLHSSSPLRLFSASWLLVPLVFFSFSGSKLPGYILPAVPGAIVFTSIFVFELVETRKLWRNVVVGSAFLTLAASLLALILIVPPFAESDSVRSLIKAADDRGHTSEKVLTLHLISHNAEFYAAGRLLRDGDGKQRALYGSSEVAAEIDAEKGSPVLVIVPLKYLSQLTNDATLKTEVLGNNGELAIAFVSRLKGSILLATNAQFTMKNAQ